MATKDKEVNVSAEIKWHDGPIMLRKGMTIAQNIEILNKRLAYDDEEVVISEPIPVFVWDGAIALAKALSQLYGYALQEPSMGLFGKQPPRIIKVESSINEVIDVPWGNFTLPGLTGCTVSTGTHTLDGRTVFQVSAKIKHRHEEAIKILFAKVREIALSESIYRGKAFRISFVNSDGSPTQLPIPKFLRLLDHPPIFSQDIETAIATNILAPIRHTQILRENGMSLKRGALLAGRYGTGKTLAANMIANECTKNGWTFIYVHNVEELPEVLRFAQFFQPAVVFGEDIDRFAGINRTDDVNNLLNTLDGIGTKSDETITILTSNHAEHINPALRRRGRIDLTLHIQPPDPEATSRLIKFYGNGLIDPNDPLYMASQALAGQIPADIREAVERAKLSAINRTNGALNSISDQDVAQTAKTMLEEGTLFAPKPAPESPYNRFAEALASDTSKTTIEILRKAGVL